MTTTPSTGPTERLTTQDYLDREFRRNVHRFADRMRQFAETIDRLGERPLIDREGHALHVRLTADVLSEFHSMVGNNSPWSMLRAAEDAQREADKYFEVQS